MLKQGLVNENYQILDVCIELPGSVIDARVFVHYSLYKEIENNHILPNQTITISGSHIPLYMIGDSAYPLESWLMKRFPHNTELIAQQRNYNY